MQTKRGIETRVGERVVLRRRAILAAALGGLCLFGSLAWPREAEAALKTMTIQNRSAYIVTVTISGYQVPTTRKVMRPNTSWTPWMSSAAQSAQVTAAVGSFNRHQRIRFGATVTIINDVPPVRPIRMR